MAEPPTQPPEKRAPSTVDFPPPGDAGEQPTLTGTPKETPSMAAQPLPAAAVTTARHEPTTTSAGRGDRPREWYCAGPTARTQPPRGGGGRRPPLGGPRMRRCPRPARRDAAPGGARSGG